MIDALDAGYLNLIEDFLRLLKFIADLLRESGGSGSSTWFRSRLQRQVERVGRARGMARR